MSRQIKHLKIFLFAAIITKTKEGHDLDVQYEEYTITESYADDPVRDMESTKELLTELPGLFSANSGL